MTTPEAERRPTDEIEVAPPGPILRAPETVLATARGTGRTGLSGSLRVEYRLRSSAGDSDHDLYQHLALRYAPASQPGWSAVLRGRLSEDLDAFGDTTGTYVLDSVADTYAHRVSGQIHEAYVQYEPLGGSIERARLGRQPVDAGDFFQLDGLHLTTRPLARFGNGTLTVFGGLPAHIYEGSIEGEMLAGAGATHEPWTGAHLRTSFVHFEDENRYYGDVQNDLFALTLRQRLRTGTNATFAYRHLNGSPHRLDLGFDHYDSERDVLLRGHVRNLLTTQSESVYDIDPYVALAQRHEPYADAHIAASKGFGDHLNLELGLSGRRLWESADEGRYNREYGRYYATLSTYDWPACDLSLALTGEGWRSRGSTEHAVTFDIDYRPRCGPRLQAGLDYALYRTDFYADEERIDSYGLFAIVRWPVRRNLSLDLRVRHEWDQDGNYTTLRAGTDLDF